jgi:hypothetical protein
MCDALALVCNSQQARAASAVALAQRRKTAIIKTTAHAQPLTFGVKTHQWQHNQIQLPQRADRAPGSAGFGNAETIGL